MPPPLVATQQMILSLRLQTTNSCLSFPSIWVRDLFKRRKPRNTQLFQALYTILSKTKLCHKHCRKENRVPNVLLTLEARTIAKQLRWRTLSLSPVQRTIRTNSNAWYNTTRRHARNVGRAQPLNKNKRNASMNPPPVPGTSSLLSLTPCNNNVSERFAYKM